MPKPAGAADWCRNCHSLRLERELSYGNYERWGQPICLDEDACHARLMQRKRRFADDSAAQRLSAGSGPRTIHYI